MKVAQAEAIQFRAQVARLASEEKLAADAAAARLVEAAVPHDDRDATPHVKRIGDLLGPRDLDALQPPERPRPTYDLAAYLANRCAEAYRIDDELEQRVATQGGTAFARFAKGFDAAFAYRRGRSLVIAFRGTCKLLQWTHTNLRAFPARAPLRHVGFQLSWERLHRDVILPARHEGYREIWLAGASLGGMGTLMYDRLHPGQTTGLILLAPYLGEGAAPDSVAAAGGLSLWTPPQTAGMPERSAWQYDLWRHLHGIAGDPAAAGRVWLAYGREDRLRPAIELFAPALPPDHVLLRDGGHRWQVWTPAMEALLRRIDAAGATAQPSP